MKVLELSGVRSGYGDLGVLRDVNLSMDEGEFVAVVGPNGAGKTTLLKTICGELPVTSGRVKVFGKDTVGAPAYRLASIQLAHAPEGRHVFAQMTVIDNLRMGAYPRRARSQFRQNLQRVFSIFPVLAEKSRHRAASLSGGQQQMLNIARAFMNGPRLMLLDEPSLGLSPRSAAEVFHAIVEINRLEVAVLLVEQNVPIALKLAPRAVVIERGAVVMEGASKALMKEPHMIEAYLGLSEATP